MSSKQSGEKQKLRDIYALVYIGLACKVFESFVRPAVLTAVLGRTAPYPKMLLGAASDPKTLLIDLPAVLLLILLWCVLRVKVRIPNRNATKNTSSSA